MQGIVGSFFTRAAADRAVDGLRSAGVPSDRIIFLTPETTEQELTIVPTTTGEAPGMGTALPSVVGGAIGAGGGMALGTAIAGALIPGVGPIFAAGVAAAALFGAGGALTGAAIGGTVERKLDTGVPKDDLELYRKLLEQGRTLVIANLETSDQIDTVRKVITDNGGEVVHHVGGIGEPGKAA